MVPPYCSERPLRDLWFRFPPVRWLCPYPCPAKHGPGTQKEKRRKANSKRRYAGLRVPNPQTGAPHRGQNKSRFRLDAAHIVPKNKMRRFQDEISGKNADRAALSGATGKSLTAAHTMHGKSRGNTDLLTCVIGNPPCAHILPSHRSSLQWRTFVPADCSASA